MTTAHDHDFLGAATAGRERRLGLVVLITLATMAVEIVAGLATGSMALLADGLHMATHAGALGIGVLAYRYARAHVADPRWSFGTAKIADLAGFTSAVVLAVVAVAIAAESVARLWSPAAVALGPALAVAIVGLGVNLACALMLREPGHDHAHDHDHGHDHAHAAGGVDTDHNYRAAFVHVLTDALTSVLAILALVAAVAFGWAWVDPAVGILGALMIGVWAWGMMRAAGLVLVDAVPDAALRARIAATLASDGDRLTDLHLWRLGPGHLGLIACVETQGPNTPDDYRRLLGDLPGLSHITIEVRRV